MFKVVMYDLNQNVSIFRRFKSFFTYVESLCTNKKCLRAILVSIDEYKTLMSYATATTGPKTFIWRNQISPTVY